MHVLTVPEVAELLRCSQLTIRSLIRAGRLPALNISKGAHPVYRVDQADLERLAVPTPDLEPAATLDGARLSAAGAEVDLRGVGG